MKRAYNSLSILIFCILSSFMFVEFANLVLKNVRLIRKHKLYYWINVHDMDAYSFGDVRW